MTFCLLAATFIVPYESQLQLQVLLDPENLPERIYYSGKTVYIRHSQVFSGFIEENPLIDGQIYHSLENAFLKATVDGKNFIIVFNGISVGLYFDGSVFYVQLTLVISTPLISILSLMSN